MSKVASLEGIVAVVKRCAFGGLEFACKLDGDRPYLQIAAQKPDNRTGLLKDLKGRKWFLSYHMTRSEVVQTVLFAVLAFVEHEARETFKYDGFSIFDPHYDVDALVGLRRAAGGSLDTRDVCDERAAA